MPPPAIGPTSPNIWNNPYDITVRGIAVESFENLLGERAAMTNIEENGCTYYSIQMCHDIFLNVSFAVYVLQHLTLINKQLSFLQPHFSRHLKSHETDLQIQHITFFQLQLCRVPLFSLLT